MPALEGRRVLVVEDEALLAVELERLLGAEGYEVIGPVASAGAAAAIARTALLDAAVLDVRLIDGDVFPAAERLKQRKIPFVFVTGTPNRIPAALRAAPILDKPCDPDALIEAVNSLVRHAAH